MVVRCVLKRLGRLRMVCGTLVLAAAAVVLWSGGDGRGVTAPPTAVVEVIRKREVTLDPDANFSDESEPRQDVIKILFVLCPSGNESDPLLSLSRQLAQADTLLKSAVYLSTMNISFYVVCSSRKIYDQVLTLTDQWPPHMLSKATFSYLPTWFPAHMQHIREVFRPCSTQRLFINHLLPEEDAVIYVDTDFIFLRSPDLLWEEFQNFNSTHMISAAMPTLMNRGDPNASKVIDFSSVGFNAGLLLINLTRLRAFPGGYEDSVITAMSEHSQIIQSDQDAMNFIFNKNRQYFRELPCPWNFRWPLCEHVRQRCAELLTQGAYAVHGLGGAFLSKQHPKMKDFHALWSRLDLSKPLPEFVSTLEAGLQTKSSGFSLCSLFIHLKQILLQQLKSRLHQGVL